MPKKRKLNRLDNFDYSIDNLYFITSLVKNRCHILGSVENGKMILNAFGHIAKEQWEWLSQRYPYVVMHEFVIMPDHIHGIIEINRHIVRTYRDLSPQEIKIKSISELMGAYKTTTSKKIHASGCSEFSWHRSFHDRIIRNDVEYYHISEYIRSNPERWDRP